MRKTIASFVGAYYNSIIIFLNRIERGEYMKLSYNKLWKILIDRKMSNADLRKCTGIAPNTLTKLRRDEAVTLEVLGRICEKLNVNIGDIMEFIY